MKYVIIVLVVLAVLWLIGAFFGDPDEEKKPVDEEKETAHQAYLRERAKLDQNPETRPVKAPKEKDNSDGIGAAILGGIIGAALADDDNDLTDDDVDDIIDAAVDEILSDDDD